jgi:hypothetical protein
MLVVEFADQVLDVEFFTKASVQLGESKLHICAQPRQLIYPLQQVAAKALLRSLREVRSLRQRNLKRFDHMLQYHNSLSYRNARIRFVRGMCRKLLPVSRFQNASNSSSEANSPRFAWASLL